MQIRDVPPDVRDRLAELARVRGQSLQTYLLALVTEDADRADNLALLSRFADRTDGTHVESPSAPESLTDDVRRMRGERTDHRPRVLDGPAR